MLNEYYHYIIGDFLALSCNGNITIKIQFEVRYCIIITIIGLFLIFVFHRLAVHNMHYVGNVLGIRDPIHKQKIALKAMDVVLFGPPRGKKLLRS